ncbi:DNA polymerase I [Brumimicrobium aurantiacum]|uniref:DNA polymerase I n=1 Tax=Brumimicrobium aurantiacum TaxID=1737063 RepID=A0A3E1EXJ1_9FLAO|nr:DNA polymerase I [Brumimicrobium aurantiacum]RFC54270.1 DNA polymerase I [Brumimicrobium aurantiacum]
MLTPKTDKKLFLLDAFALIYRSYFAFFKNPRMNSKGENTSAAFGFTNAMLDVIKKEEPTHIAVVFDPPGGATNRIDEYSEYKAQREKMPEDIRNMIEPIKRIIEAFKIPILMKEGYEADDVIGTLAKMAEKEGFQTFMMTPDKDFGQLVSENIFMYKPGRGKKPAEVWGVPEVLEKFEVENPLQVIDILGLWGDASDNIPGIPGIGEKTAKKLVKAYGSMEGLFENIDQLKGKQKENVTNFQEQGLLSKKLATIITDVDVPFDVDDLEICPHDDEKIREIFTELEFRSLAKRILGEELVITATNSGTDADNGQLDLFGTASNSSQESPAEVPVEEMKSLETETVEYNFFETEEAQKELIAQLLKQKSVCFDTETNTLEARNADLVGIAFSFKAKEAFYVPFPEDFEEAKTRLEKFAPFFNSTEIEKVAHNIKYDEQVINRYGIKLRGPKFDTMIAHYLLTPDSKHGMDHLAEYYLKYTPVPIENLIGKKGKNQKTMRDIEQKEIVDYACEDADITWQLKELFEPQIQKDHLKDLFYNMEMPLTTVLKAMEQEGIQLDIESLKKFSEELTVSLTDIEEKVIELAGEEFNLASPKQLGEILFEKLEIAKKPKKTKSGQYSTSEDTLQKHINDHEIIPLILDYRSLRKLKNTYVDPLPELVDENDGRLHTHYMQTVAATGRLSSTNPNLQNIPIRTPKGREIRKAFVAKNDDYYLMAADYSQIELRIIAALSEDANMIEAFQNGQDIHAATAAKVFGVDINEVSREQRSNAKAVNFGIIYGQSAFGLSQNLGISRREAKSIIDSYFEQYPTIKAYMEKVKEEAKEKGYVETIMKRRRYLPDIHSKNAIVRGFAERNAINAPIQGSAADIIKVAMINIYNKMREKKLTSRMLLQVHDELVFDVLKSEKDIVANIVKEEMEGAVQLEVPLDIEMEFATNWLEAH